MELKIKVESGKESLSSKKLDHLKHFGLITMKELRL